MPEHTGLAVWFRRRDQQWLLANQGRMLLLAVLLVLVCSATLFSTFGMSWIYRQVSAAVWLSWTGIFSSLSALQLVYAFCFIYLASSRLEFCNPPAELIGPMTETEFTQQALRFHLTTSALMSLVFMFPLMLSLFAMSVIPVLPAGTFHPVLAVCTIFAASLSTVIAGLLPPMLTLRMETLKLPLRAAFGSLIIARAALLVVRDFSGMLPYCRTSRHCFPRTTSCCVRSGTMNWQM
ncbi:MAG: hypothetical protein R3F46_05800 [bacterium]